MAKKYSPPIRGITLTWWQTSLFKISCISFGLLLAHYFGEFFAQFTTLLWITTLIPGLYLGYVWFHQR